MYTQINDVYSNKWGRTTISWRIEVQAFYKDAEAKQLARTYTHNKKREKGVSKINALSMEKCIKIIKTWERDLYM